MIIMTLQGGNAQVDGGLTKFGQRLTASVLKYFFKSEHTNG